MRTPAHAVAVLALGASLLAGCKPERSGTTTAPSEAAPSEAAPAPVAPASPGGPQGGAAPAITATQGAGEVDANAPTFEVAGLSFTRPEGWALVAPGPMRAAQLENPGIPGATIVFTHFGERGAGAVADNLTRWARQVVNEQGEPTLPEVTEASADIGDVTRKITFARYRGTYMAGMPGQQPTPAPGTLFLGAIIEGGPRGPVYMRAHGPEGAMRDQVPAVLSMLLGERAE